MNAQKEQKMAPFEPKATQTGPKTTAMAPKRAAMEREVGALQQRSRAQLKARYQELFGHAARGGIQRQFLIRRIAWGLQTAQEGDLSERARERARTLARDGEVRLTAPKWLAQAARSGPPRDPRLPAPGAVLTRRFQGRAITVEVLEKGFRYEDATYRSLSAVARRISGTQWNGFTFFARSLREVRPGE